jgi:flagellum-specific ATP synthase
MERVGDVLSPRRLAPAPVIEGRVLRYDGLILEATGFPASPGTLCEIATESGNQVQGEVIGFARGHVMMFLNQPGAGIIAGARVRVIDGGQEAEVGEALLGRVVDAEGHPLDGMPSPRCDAVWPLAGRLMNPLARLPVDRPLDVGVRIINAALTVGRGQRVGIIAGSGVGKSVLMEMMARYTEADVIVVGLIGERGREVKEFIEDILGEEGRRRSVVVAAPADAPPLTRMQGANYATAIAEHFRDRGAHVLLLMDSLTRYAMAQREIALAIGEPPATKGYPPSCFAKLPQLVERSGNGIAGGGSITAFYTVLSEGDDQQDPIADAARGILDGHITLSRELAESGHYPAIDVERSISRVMTNVAEQQHIDAARRFRQLHSKHQKARDLIQLGAYSPGHDVDLDAAVRLHDPMISMLQQDMNQPAGLEQSVKRLRTVMAL